MVFVSRDFFASPTEESPFGSVVGITESFCLVALSCSRLFVPGGEWALVGMPLPSC